MKVSSSIYYNVSFERQAAKSIKRFKFFLGKKNILAVIFGSIYLGRQQKIRVFALSVRGKLIGLRTQEWF